LFQNACSKLAFEASILGATSTIRNSQLNPHVTGTNA